MPLDKKPRRAQARSGDETLQADSGIEYAELASGKLKDGEDVVAPQLVVVGEELLTAHPGGEEFKLCRRERPPQPDRGRLVADVSPLDPQDPRFGGFKLRVRQ